MRADRAPTVEDAFVAGLPLGVGVKLEGLIKAEPGVPAEEWWDLFAKLVERFGPRPQSPAAPA